MSRPRPLAVALMAVLAIAAVTPPPASAQQPRPNVVIMYADNLGYGEVGIYGGVRGVPTPRLDALAREGLRVTNFNVETFCTPSRTALLTGRYGIRSGTLGFQSMGGERDRRHRPELLVDGRQIPTDSGGHSGSVYSSGPLRAMPLPPPLPADL